MNTTEKLRKKIITKTLTVQEYKNYRQLDLKNKDSFKSFVDQFNLSKDSTLDDINNFIVKQTLLIGEGNKFKGSYKIGKRTIDFVKKYEDIKTSSHISIQEYINPETDYLIILDKILPYFIKDLTDDNYDEYSELILQMDISDAIGLIFFLFNHSRSGTKGLKINQLNNREQLYRQLI